jgi:hypothetical protein
MISSKGCGVYGNEIGDVSKVSRIQAQLSVRMNLHSLRNLVQGKVETF